MVLLMPLPPPIICGFFKIQIGLTFVVPAYSGSPGKEAVKWVSICLSVCLKVAAYIFILSKQMLICVAHFKQADVSLGSTLVNCSYTTLYMLHVEKTRVICVKLQSFSSAWNGLEKFHMFSNNFGIFCCTF